MYKTIAAAVLLGALAPSSPAHAQVLEYIRPTLDVMEELAWAGLFKLRLEYVVEMDNGQKCLAFSRADARVWCPDDGFVPVSVATRKRWR